MRYNTPYTTFYLQSPARFLKIYSDSLDMERTTQSWSETAASLSTMLCFKQKKNERNANIRLEVSGGKNPILDESQGSTALYIACRFTYTPIVDKLIRAGVPVNVVELRRGRAAPRYSRDEY
ncbi:hypothetical protein F5Y07DRAFT_101162 [Xylaria sp. FL0933]|nr:hypothetical protein F5Y07DRAFT_101162 [Xylaria sp. FL0933]